MDLQALTEAMRERVGEDSGLGASAKFVFEDGSVIYIDGGGTPNSVDNQDRDADCTLRIAFDDFMSIRNSELDATTAFMMGKLKIEGDMGVAMKLQGLL